ncbi:MAG TPA: hypothetical protein PKX87_09705 [Alphaproteobacteria bacterium]|nr:hypothetical protein [Alphaproteobacteria bacterium]
MSKMITATFKTRDAAFSALRDLEAIGVTDKQVSMVVTDDTRGKTFNIEKSSKADEGAAAGATVGGIIGAVAAAIAGAGALAIPGLNVVVAGTLISALAGLGAGAATGGLVGGLIGAGIPEHEAKIYENEVKNGAILLAVEPSSDSQREQISNILKRRDAYNVAA